MSLTTTRSPGCEQLGQIADVAVLGRGAAPVDEQPGGVAWLDRHLGDQRRVEVVVEVLEAHQPQATVARHERASRVDSDCRCRDGEMDVHVWIAGQRRGSRRSC